ncbi:MAG TPA: hypothetical protein VKJ01_14995, partial [Candidatus Solibacter sp.]|nr:hypothetical protein [Candidatus Solibacter sp.]
MRSGRPRARRPNPDGACAHTTPHGERLESCALGATAAVTAGEAARSPAAVATFVYADDSRGGGMWTRPRAAPRFAPPRAPTGPGDERLELLSQ